MSSHNSREEQSSQSEPQASTSCQTRDELLARALKAEAERDEARRRQNELAVEVAGLRNSYWEERKARLLAQHNSPQSASNPGEAEDEK